MSVCWSVGWSIGWSVGPLVSPLLGPLVMLLTSQRTTYFVYMNLLGEKLSGGLLLRREKHFLEVKVNKMETVI